MVATAHAAYSGYNGTDALDTLQGDDLVLGIDLGTSNSAACCLIDGKPVVIDLRDSGDMRAGVRSIPSVVAFDENSNSKVGTTALAQMATDPKRVVSGAKRFLGRQYDSPSVQKMLAHFPNKIVPTKGGAVGVEINGRVKSLAAISAYILQAIHQRAEAQLNRPIRKAIITVPAYYNDNQRDGVVQAGRMAGLDVVRVLNEPTAAAIAYGLNRPQHGTFLVYDLGGGTFDVSIIRVEPKGLRVLATAGDTFLGGEDFDMVIVNAVYERYRVANGGVALSHNSGVQAQIKLIVEQAKRRLSLREETPIAAKDLMRADRKLGRIEMTLARREIEKLVEPFVADTLQICDQALRDAKLRPADISEVILVGGQTQMPYVRERVEKHFGRVPRTELNPDETVALGAGMFPEINKRMSFMDVLPMTIGVAVRGTFQPVIARNTPLPHRRQVTFVIPRGQLNDFRLELWQGESAELRKNERLGVVGFERLQTLSAGPVPIAVELAVTKDCLLHVQIVNTDTGESHFVLLRAGEVGAL